MWHPEDHLSCCIPEVTGELRGYDMTLLLTHLYTINIHVTITNKFIINLP